MEPLDLTPSEQDSYRRAKDLAARRLSRRECSAHDIRQYLIRKGIPSEMSARVVEEFVKLNFISDERFAAMFTRDQVGKGKGSLQIRQKLRIQGIHLDALQAKTLTEESGQKTELELARALLERRFPLLACSGSPDRKEVHRAIQMLLRRGFSYSVAREALQRGFDENSR